MPHSHLAMSAALPACLCELPIEVAVCPYPCFGIDLDSVSFRPWPPAESLRSPPSPAQPPSGRWSPPRRRAWASPCPLLRKSSRKDRGPSNQTGYRARLRDSARGKRARWRGAVRETSTCNIAAPQRLPRHRRPEHANSLKRITTLDTSVR